MRHILLPFSAAQTTCFTFSPDSAMLWLGLDDGTLICCDPSGAPRARHAAHTAPITALAFSPDGRQLATGAGDGEVCVWEIEALLSETPLVRRVERRLKQAITALAWSEQGDLAATDSVELSLGSAPARISPTPIHTLISWDGYWSGGGEELVSWPGAEARPVPTEGRVQMLCGNAEERLLLVGLESGAVIDHPWASGRTIARSDEPTSCWAAAVARGFCRLVAGHRDGRLSLWLHTRGSQPAPLASSWVAHDGPVTAVAFAPDGSGIVSAGADGRLSLWLQGESEQVRAPKRDYARWIDASLSSSGDLLLASELSLALPGGSITVSDPRWGGFGAAQWAPSGALLSVDGERATIRRLDLSGRELALREEQDSFAGGFAVDPWGWIALSLGESAILVLDESLRERQRLTISGRAAALAWSRSGELAALEESGQLTVWADRGERVLLSMQVGYAGGLRQALSWSRAWLAVAAHPTVVVDTASGRVVRELPWSHSVAFSEGGQLAAGGYPEIVTVWDLQRGLPVAWWRRSLSDCERLLLLWRSEAELFIVTEQIVTRWELAPS